MYSKHRDADHQGEPQGLLRAALQGVHVGRAKLRTYEHRARLPLERRDRHVREQHQAELRRAVRQRVVAQEGAGRHHQEELEEHEEPPGRAVRSLVQGQGRPAQATPAEDVAPLYHAWIDEQRHLVLAARDLEKDNVHYDIQCSPQDYLPCMLRMMMAVEAHGTSVKNACPHRSNVVPKHVRIDTTSLVNLCFTKEQDTTWGFFFKTNMKCFRAKGYTFDHQIETGGVGCSILLKREDLPGERVIEAKKGNSETYIDEVADYEPLKGKTIVAIDPNMSDLLYCVDGDTKEQTRFRYTQDTRRKETKVKKYREYVQQRKQEVIDGKRVVEWEAELSAYDRKTTDFDFERFKAYVKKKNEVNRRLSLVYNQYIFWKLKLGGYMRRQITEARLLKRFEKRSRHDRRDRGLEPEAAPQVQRARQGQGQGLQDDVSEGGLRRVPGSMSSAPAAGAARANRASARRSGNARTLDRTGAAKSFVTGWSGGRLVPGCGTEIRMPRRTSGRWRQERSEARVAPRTFEGPEALSGATSVPLNHG